MRRDAMPARAMMMTTIAAITLALALASGAARAQEPAVQPPVLRARSLESMAPVRVMNPAGSVRIVGWDHDSILVRGRIARGERFFFGGSAKGVKFGIEDRVDGHDSQPSELVVYLPRRSQLSVKCASADIAATDVSGSFYSVSGSIRLAGSATSIDAETMNGAIDLDVAAPWVRARTGDGPLTLRGAASDVDLSTIAGTLGVRASSVRRGRLASVTGDIRVIGAPPEDALLELSNHEGAVELLVPRDARGVFDLSTVSGAIENGFGGAARPAAGAAGRGGTLRVQLGGGGGAHVTVRTFKGAIRLRPR
jgi:hypothetical protein